jgi:hypothetical protein
MSFAAKLAPRDIRLRPSLPELIPRVYSTSNVFLYILLRDNLVRRTLGNALIAVIATALNLTLPRAHKKLEHSSFDDRTTDENKVHLLNAQYISISSVNFIVLPTMQERRQQS